MNRTRRTALAAAILTVSAAGAVGVAGAAPPDSSGQGWRAHRGTEAANGWGEGQGRRWAGHGTGKATGVRQGAAGARQGVGAGDHAAIPEAVPGATITRKVRKELRYLVEEEKLAGDIYALAESIYGDRVFANIARAEDSHAEQVRLLLDRYDVTDPTKSRATGEFRDRDLQRLYDRLASQVRKSRADAVKAGILIEKTDIADLKVLLAKDLPADVEQVAENLLAGSQRHLAAFRRQA